MTRLDKIKHDIQNLSQQDFVKLQKWFAKFLIEEAKAVKSDEKVTTHHNLDFLAGTWSDEDVREFEEATAYFGQIDEEMWVDDSAESGEASS